MTTPKDWMRAQFPGFAELCDRQRMEVGSEGAGPRGEWVVGMRSTRFALWIGKDLGVHGYHPIISIRGLRQKRGRRVDKVLQDLGLWEQQGLPLNERELAKVLEAHLDAVLEYLENDPL